MSEVIKKIEESNPGKQLFWGQHCGEFYFGVEQHPVCPHCEEVVETEPMTDEDQR